MSPPLRNSVADLSVCIVRSVAASIWVLGCHIFILWLPILQGIVALWFRFGVDQSYSPIETRSDSGISDIELGSLMELPRDANGVLIAPIMRENFCRSPCNGHAESVEQAAAPEEVVEEILVDAQNLSTAFAAGACGVSAARMAVIAANLKS